MSYIHFKTLARYFLDGDISKQGIRNIFDILFSLLNKKD